MGGHNRNFVVAIDGEEVQVPRKRVRKNKVGGSAVTREKFVEENGRRVFLLYLKPIINGTGNYYIEAQTRDQSRTDVIVDYLGKQYVIELKIWRGNEYNKRGEKQTCRSRFMQRFVLLQKKTGCSISAARWLPEYPAEAIP